MAENGLSIAQQALINKIAQNWAKEMQTSLKQRVAEKGLVKSGTLRRSIKLSLIKDGVGRADRIKTVFQWYGLFHESGASGAGRGKNLNLPAKHWLRPYLFGSDLDQLTEEISEVYANACINAIEELGIIKFN